MSSKRQRHEPLSCSFKIHDASHAHRLLQEAEQFDTSPSLRAREILADYFDQQEAEAKRIANIEELLKELRQQIRLLRGDLATSVRALLVHAAGQSSAKSKLWVEENLLEAGNAED